MIIREWRGRAHPENAGAYPLHFHQNVVSELSSIPGFLGAHLSRREIGDRVEFLVLTRWKSMEAIQRFAGASPEQAVVEPGAIAALADFDSTVAHYAVLEEVPAAAGRSR